MIRTLIFGAIAGYVGKKLYDEGKLTEFKEDLVSRYQQAREGISSNSSTSADTSHSSTPAITPSASARISGANAAVS